jgi:hypothetical protein
MASSFPKVMSAIQGAGLSLTLTSGSDLKVTPATRMTPEVRELIRSNKPELVKWLMEAANESNAATEANPDRWCWPNGTAMNGAEIDTFMARLGRFTAKGLTHDAGEALADKLVIRDRESDDRRSCLECSNLAGSGSWRCRNWRQADVALRANDAALPADLVNLLQRCHGFSTGFDIRDIDLLLGSDALQ